jgi:hypothetical protein
MKTTTITQITEYANQLRSLEALLNEAYEYKYQEDKYWIEILINSEQDFKFRLMMAMQIYDMINLLNDNANQDVELSQIDFRMRKSDLSFDQMIFDYTAKRNLYTTPSK